MLTLLIKMSKNVIQNSMYNNNSNWEIFRNVKFSFNTIYIIESLFEERKTGKWLYEEIQNYQYKFKDFKIEYVPVYRKEELIKLLEDINQKSKNENRFPVIHLEAHGDKKGFNLYDENGQTESVDWSELSPIFKDINNVTKNNLLITLGACYGSYLGMDSIEEFSKEDRASFLVLIAPTEKIYPDEIKLGFSSLYKELFDSGDFGKALNSILKYTDKNILQASPLLARKFVIEMKKIVDSNEFTLENRVFYEKLGEDVKNEIKGQNFNRTMKNVSKYRKIFFKESMEKRYNKYLMIDIYPENVNKFLAFEDIWKQ